MKTIANAMPRIGLWIGLIAIILLTGTYCFQQECRDLNFWGALYYTLRLFILEHDLPVFPKSWPLGLLYFLAPLVAFSALWRVVALAFQFSPNLRTRWMKNHIIVCGVGRTGKNLASMLREKQIDVVGVDSGPSEQFDDWLCETKVPLLFGDFLSCRTLARAGAANARSIIFASGDDLLNIEAAVQAYAWIRNISGPIRLIWAHVASEKLSEATRTALQTSGNVGIRLFDTYRIAAVKMVEEYFGPSIRKDVKEITVLGFGKFGRDLFEVLISVLEPLAGIRYTVVDVQDRRRHVESLARELAVPHLVTFMQSDINDLSLENGEQKAFFLCTDDDIGNLTAALMLTKSDNGTPVFVRMANWPMPAIENHLCEKRGLTFVNINSLVKDGIEDMAGVFAPAVPSDLKRAVLNFQ